MLARCNRVSLF